ncbi:glycosyltransferase family 8 protein [Paenibacillus sp. FSL K6-0276]|uniref:glycosyltransferase family 8 protein n=1 Tax=Paenibacillus sp. FSL K6-0276 TaxID=2921450 RepID=UPI0030EF040B
MIEIALAFQDKDGQYAEHAGVVLASIFQHTSSPIHVHILHDISLTEDNKRKLDKLTTKHHHTISYYSITLPDDMLQVLANINSISVWTQACMYRLLLPALIPVDKIIYLDCDVLVNMDITDLWQVELGDKYLGAIWDQAIMEVAHIVSSKGLNPELYFNSGVILFSLNNIRQNSNWYVEMLNFLRTFPDVTMPDQDVLNAVFGGNYLPLDIRFNSFNMAIPDHDFNNKIVHFAGDKKCWNKDSPGSALYNQLLNLTPWRTFSTKIKRRKRKVSYVKRRFTGKSSSRKIKIVPMRISPISLSDLKLIKPIRRNKAILINTREQNQRRITRKKTTSIMPKLDPRVQISLK